MRRSWGRKINKDDLLKVIKIANEYSPIGSNEDYFVKDFMNEYRWLYLDEVESVGEVSNESKELIRFNNLSDINLEYLRNVSSKGKIFKYELAEEVGIHPATYSMKERGESSIFLEEFDWYMQAMGYDIELIVRRK